MIELLVVFAILGILASLAVSAHQTYSVRGQVSDGLQFAASLESPVIDVFRASGVAPADLLSAGVTTSLTDATGTYVSRVEIVDGRIDLTYGGPLAHQGIIGTTLSLTPYVTADDAVVWRCGSAPAPAGSPLPGGAAHVPPTVDRRYLPGRCRE